MNQPEPLWESNINTKWDFKKTLQPIVLSAMTALGWCAATHVNAKANKISLSSTQISSTYDYPDHTETDIAEWKKISESIQLHMSNHDKSIEEYAFNIWEYQSFEHIADLVWDYSLAYTFPDSITVFSLSTFDDDMKILRKEISQILDYDSGLFGLKWCTNVFKWRRELEFIFGYNCDDIKNPVASGNIWTYYSKTVDGTLIHTPRPECKIYKKRKWRDNKPLENLNVDTDFLDRIDKEAFEKVYRNTCITKRSIRELMDWWR